MSNGRRATGVGGLVEQVAAAAAGQQQEQQGGSIFQGLQGLPAPVRPHKTQMALAVEVIPNPNLDGAKKLLMVTIMRATGVEFIGFEPDEWDSFAEMVQARMAEARSVLEVAQPGQIPDLLRPAGPVPHV